MIRLLRIPVAKIFLWVFWEDIVALGNEAENGFVSDAYKNGVKRCLTRLSLISE